MPKQESQLLVVRIILETQGTKLELGSQELRLRNDHPKVLTGFETLEFVNVGLVVLFGEIKVFLLPPMSTYPPNTCKSNVQRDKNVVSVIVGICTTEFASSDKCYWRTTPMFQLEREEGIAVAHKKVRRCQ